MKYLKYTMVIMLFVLLYAFATEAHEADSPFKNSDIERTLKDGKVQKFDGDKYKIVPRHQKKKVVKTEKVVVKDDCGCKNRASVLVGHGSLGNLKVRDREARTENGLVLGVQYMRDFREDGFHLLIQAQTNETFSVGAGLDF